MHSTTRPFVTQRSFLNTEMIQRYEDLYREALDSIERRIECDLVVNAVQVANDLGISTMSMSLVIARHPPLARLFGRCKRALGCCADDRLHL